MSIAKRVPLIVPSMLGITVLAACEAPPVPTDTGVPWELAEHRKATIQGLSYRIELEIPAEREAPIRGRSLINFTLRDPDRQPVVLDFLNPGERVSRVSVNGVEAPWQPVNDHVVIDATAFRDGSNEVDIAYTAGDEALNRNEEFLYTLFVPDRAHFSLPVFDQPNLKARVRWELTVPEDWTAVANAPGVDRTSGAGRTTYRYLDSRPIPTYLFAFAAGKFETEWMERDGRRIVMYHRETDEEKVERNREQILDLHFRALAWLEEYTGIPYPFQKFEFVLIPPFQYGGMEHPGSILYRQGSLMLDETATQGQILGRASLIAHETAHMWFGDLVTMNWFDDVWTKEVFANFMAAKIVHPSFPALDHDLRFLMAHHPSAYGVDRTAGANPIRQPLENLRFAGTLYGAIIYQKAPIVMRQLEARVGEEAFRDGLREYLETFAYGNAAWPDLIDILDARSPEDLSAWSRVWVDEPGRPTITVRRAGDDLVLEPSDPHGLGRVWPQTLHLLLGGDEGQRRETVELAGAPVTLQGALRDGPSYVLPNGSGLEYGGFVLDEASLTYLAANVGSLEPALARGAAWVTLWDQVLEGRLDQSAFLDVALAAVAGEEDELNLSRVLGYLRSTYWDLLSPEARRERAAEVEAALWAGVASDRPTTARSSFFGAWRGTALTPDAVARMRRLWDGSEEVPGLPLSENDQTALATALALRSVADAESVLDTQQDRIANPDRSARFRFVRPSLSADLAVRRDFFESLRDPANREREPWVLSGLNNLHHPLRGDEGVEFVVPALEMVEEIQRTGDIFFPGRWLDATLGGHTQPEVADAVRDFLEASPQLSPRLRAKVQQSADMVFRSARTVHGWR
jgi:aminopeptidase N